MGKRKKKWGSPSPSRWLAEAAEEPSAADEGPSRAQVAASGARQEQEAVAAASAATKSREELERMQISELRRLALARSIRAASLEAAMDQPDGDSRKSALLNLLLPAAPSREEFEGMKLSELVKAAERRSIDPAAIDLAVNAADSKSALLDLLVPPAAAVLFEDDSFHIRYGKCI